MHGEGYDDRGIGRPTFVCVLCCFCFLFVFCTDKFCGSHSGRQLGS